MSPFRDHSYSELCWTCKKPATYACEFCNRPACGEHVLDDGSMCEECGADLYVAESGAGRRLVVVGGSVGGGSAVALLALVAASAFPGAILATLFGLSVAGAASLVWGSRVSPRLARRAFKNQRRPKQLPAGDTL